MGARTAVGGRLTPCPRRFQHHLSEREFFIDSLLVRIHFIIVMIWWTGLAPWEGDLGFDLAAEAHGVRRVRHSHHAPLHLRQVSEERASFQPRNVASAHSAEFRVSETLR